MLRRGRQKTQNIEISILSFTSLMKYLFLIILLSPWIYMIFFKFEAVSMLEASMEAIFGPGKEYECQNPKTPYLLYF